MSDPSAEQPRDGGGRFSHKPAGEVELDLSQPNHDEGLPNSAEVITAGPDELDEYVYHDSWQVRADATANPHLNDEHVEFLTDPDQHIGVRSGMALHWRPGVADRLRNDPSETVRAMAAGSWEYTAADRERLTRDPAVARIHRLFFAPAQ
ncbi:hypothetical protein [Ornithinimicrobium murale]|uniref:hypothetical protein n=1 Tax=Ornithinimicrobium murale TaxID=1050153 RepID=UPI000E0D58D3|nr:hypothetical protein [Ornithinimicrobium murale]